MKFKRSLRKDKWRRAVVGLKTEDGDTQIVLWTKLGDAFGMSVSAAAEAWLKVSQDFSAESLVKFINESRPGYAMTEDHFEAYRKKVRDEYN